MSSNRYGNDRYWVFFDISPIPGKEYAIWKGPEGKEEIIGHSQNKYFAKEIVDALISYTPVEDKTKFGRKELAFLEFMISNAVEPYATMASNAILWGDWETYNKLKSEFHVIYS